MYHSLLFSRKEKERVSMSGIVFYLHATTGSYTLTPLLWCLYWLATLSWRQVRWIHRWSSSSPKKLTRFSRRPDIIAASQPTSSPINKPIAASPTLPPQQNPGRLKPDFFTNGGTQQWARRRQRQRQRQWQWQRVQAANRSQRIHAPGPRKHGQPPSESQRKPKPVPPTRTRPNESPLLRLRGTALRPPPRLQQRPHSRHHREWNRRPVRVLEPTLRGPRDTGSGRKPHHRHESQRCLQVAPHRLCRLHGVARAQEVSIPFPLEVPNRAWDRGPIRSFAGQYADKVGLALCAFRIILHCRMDSI